MVAITTYKRGPAKSAPIDDPHRKRLLRRNVSNGDSATVSGSGSTCWQALRVLIVDHEQDVARRRLLLIARGGHAVRLAYHGQAGLIVAADQHPDVVLLNLELPSMDGRRLARQLRIDSPQSECFIIGLADWADDERHRQCNEAGIDLLLIKPVDPSVLDVLLGLEWVRINRQCAAEARPHKEGLNGNRSESR